MGGAGFLMSKNNIKGKTYLFDSFQVLKKMMVFIKKMFFYEDIDSIKKILKN